MVERWGYKLPERPCEKSFRACYRAASQHCLMQDVSFLQCLELEGPQGVLVEQLDKLTASATGTTFGSAAFLTGEREGCVTVYNPGSYPNGVIGHVTLMWKPGKKMDKRTLWLWIHPSIYPDVLRFILELFPNMEKCSENFEAKSEPMEEGGEVVGVGDDEMKVEEVEKEEVEARMEGEKVKDEVDVDKENSGNQKKKKAVVDVDQKKLETTNVPFERTPKWSNDVVTIAELKGTLNRFALRGPLAQKVLSAVLKAANVEEKSIPQPIKKEINHILDEWSEFEDKVKEKKIPIFEKLKDKLNMRRWWRHVFTAENKRGKNLAMHNEQTQVWESLENVLPGQLPPRMVLGLTVRDPRMFLPPKRDKQISTTAVAFDEGILSSNISQSFLWGPKIRDYVTISKISDNLLNRQRGDLALGQELSLGDKESRIPVILVQSPGSQGRNGKSAGLGAGWDLILPAGWGMAFWVSLVYNGARVGGLREEEMFNFECALPRGLLNLIDSAAGKREIERKKEILTEEYFKRPPNNRINLIKLGIHWAFEPPLERLVKEWNGEGSNYYVLRHVSALNRIDKTLSAAVSEKEKKRKALFRVGGQFFIRKDDHLSSVPDGTVSSMEIDTAEAAEPPPSSEESRLPEDLLEVQPSLKDSLIPVRVIMLSRGSPEGYTSLCLPVPSDIAQLDATNSFPGPVEPLKEDLNDKKRKQMRNEHQRELKQMKRKRKQARDEMFIEKARKLNEKVKKVEKSGVCLREEMEKEEEAKAEAELKERHIKELLEANASEKCCEKYKEENKNLWIPTCESLRFSNTREIVGFGLIGGFSYTESKGAAFGYIVGSALPRILASSGYVLVREATSQQYRFGTLSVLQ